MHVDLLAIKSMRKLTSRQLAPAPCANTISMLRTSGGEAGQRDIIAECGTVLPKAGQLAGTGVGIGGVRGAMVPPLFLVRAGVQTFFCVCLHQLRNRTVQGKTTTKNKNKAKQKNDR